MDQIFYIAARSQEKNGGIYGYGQDDGHSCEQVFFTPLKGVSYLAYSPKRRYLYAVYKEGTANKVASYDLSDDSTLVFMNSVETHGESKPAIYFPTRSLQASLLAHAVRKSYPYTVLHLHGL